MGNAIEPKHHGPDPQWYKDPSHRGKGGGGNSYSTPTRIQHRPQHFMRGMAAEQPESARVPHFCAFWGSLWPRTVICRWSFADRKRVRRTFVISNRH